MSTQTDLARLQSELDDPFTPLLLALADWHEETDQPALARAYRRIAAEGKVPDLQPDGWTWLNGGEGDELMRRYEVPFPVVKAAREYLPVRAGYCDEGTALSQAYHALALAYAEIEKESASG